jgi:hypothetical protein
MLATNQSSEPKQVDVSFACIAHKSEAHHVMQMIATLPSGCEVVVLWNEQGDNLEVVERKKITLNNGTVVRYYETQWQELHFANLRNLCIGLCSRGWVMWIDADDRLLTHQHSWFDDLTIYPAGVGGLVCGCVGVQPKHEGNSNVMRYHHPQTRVFRNNKAFAFKGAAHEQITWSIEQQGLTLETCSLLVHHVGYEVDADSMMAKVRRNVKGLAREIADCTDDDQLVYWTQMIHRDSGSFMYYVTKDK